MKKEELRTAIQEMNTYQFGQKKELTNKLSKVTSYVVKQEVLDMVSKLDKEVEDVKPELPVIPQFVADWLQTPSSMSDDEMFNYMLRINWNEDDGNNDTVPSEVGGYVTNNDNLLKVLRIIKGEDYTIEPEKKYILKNKRGFVSSIQVKQSRNDLTSNIIFNYTPYQQDAYKFSQKEKEFYKDSFYLEEVEVTIK